MIEKRRKKHLREKKYFEMFKMMELSPKTCEKHEATEGLACNKTIFLLQEYMQVLGCPKVWTVKNYERDRFGLLNGIISIIKNEIGTVEFYFGSTNTRGYYYMVVRRTMTFKEISKLVDSLFSIGEVYYA